MGDIHVLSVPVPSGTSMCLGDDVRTLGGKPCGNGVSGSTYDYGNAVCGGGLQHSVQMREIEHTFLRFPSAPCGFRDTDRVDICLTHHFHICFYSVAGKVLVIICGSE